MKNQIKQMAASLVATDPRFDAPNTAWEAAKLFEKASTDLAPDAPPEARQFVALMADAANMAACVAAGNLPRSYLTTTAQTGGAK
jgi:hypothetical protein